MFPSYFKIKILVKCRVYSTLGLKGLNSLLLVHFVANIYSFPMRSTATLFNFLNYHLSIRLALSNSIHASVY